MFSHIKKKETFDRFFFFLFFEIQNCKRIVELYQKKKRLKKKKSITANELNEFDKNISVE